jgi:hypothetical protein
MQSQTNRMQSDTMHVLQNQLWSLDKVYGCNENTLTVGAALSTANVDQIFAILQYKVQQTTVLDSDTRNAHQQRDQNKM